MLVLNKTNIFFYIPWYFSNAKVVYILDASEISIKDEKKIQANLAPLRENLKKKMRAQEAYYNSNKVNRSPLLFNRRPVRDRLGKVRFLGTDTSGILPRPRHFLHGGGNFKNNFKQGKFSAQMRLNRLRARLNASTQNKNRPFRLRRNTSFFDDGPTNLTVQVDNTQHSSSGSFKIENGFPDMRFRPVLNAKVQEQIATIQENRYYQEIFPMRFTSASTQVSMHDRFTTYMI